MSDNNDNIMEEMWTELQSYQPFADSEGHGHTWRTMCEQRTTEAAQTAALEARQFDAPFFARIAAWDAADALHHQQLSNTTAREKEKFKKKVAECARRSCDSISLAKDRSKP